MKRVSLILSAVLMTAMMVTSCGEGASNEESSPSEESSPNEVTIGKQVWMTQNLNVDKFRNGDPIPEAKTDEEWEKAGINGEPAWCYYNNNPDNGDRYGKLYNWYAVNDPRGLAPEGCKIPSDEEWSRLTDFLGGESVAGEKMKFTDFWDDNDGESGNGTNESGFSGLPGGFRNLNDTFEDIGKAGFWWSSTEIDRFPAWYRTLSYRDGDVGSYNDFKSLGLSVRCLSTASPNEVTIGKQVWMSENLNVDKFRNGDPIPHAKTAEEWMEAGDNKQPVWCYYNNNPDNGDRYGKLYNWYAVNDSRGLAPEGWKIPSVEDWTELTDYLGGESVAGGRLKATGTIEAGTGLWHEPNTLATNETGFTALSCDGYTGKWWSATERSATNAYYLDMGYKSSGVLLFDYYKEMGYPVRCVKD